MISTQFPDVDSLFAAIRGDKDHHDHIPLSEFQAEVGYGDYFVEFVDLDRNIISFGHVLPITKVESLALWLGARQGLVDSVVHAVRQEVVFGSLFSQVFDRLAPQGRFTAVHRAHVWPIPAETFAAAERAGYDSRLLDQTQRAVIVDAFMRQKAHVQQYDRPTEEQ